MLFFKGIHNTEMVKCINTEIVTESIAIVVDL